MKRSSKERRPDGIIFPWSKTDFIKSTFPLTLLICLFNNDCNYKECSFVHGIFHLFIIAKKTAAIVGNGPKPIRQRLNGNRVLSICCVTVLFLYHFHMLLTNLLYVSWGRKVIRVSQQVTEQVRLVIDKASDHTKILWPNLSSHLTRLGFFLPLGLYLR